MFKIYIVYTYFNNDYDLTYTEKTAIKGYDVFVDCLLLIKVLMSKETFTNYQSGDTVAFSDRIPANLCLRICLFQISFLSQENLGS